MSELQKGYKNFTKNYCILFTLITYMLTIYHMTLFPSSYTYLHVYVYVCVQFFLNYLSPLPQNSVCISKTLFYIVIL